ncbi:transketolase [Roseospira visakhapatnamensis]|uniref:Transketolase n=1 Tax=Roseospira visakhapatnamensis TaxID=390880 RepID=A0A7W6RF12_9PROT|nr:transketolase [Roseospira visakhapatnamensis]MBB4266834.1 transketolase [Roseospira visakhapatnamensis]
MTHQSTPAAAATIAPHTEMANCIRFLAADAVQAAKSGHPGMPMGMADVATVLYTRFLKFDAADPAWPDRDRFVLSAGHGSMLIYALSYLTGMPGMDMDDLRNFRQLGSKTAGHPEYGHAPGIEVTTGPLGQGIATSVGMALGERMAAARYGDTLVDHYTYVIAGDGCLMEGISQEAISMAGHLKLGKLIVLWDDNSISIDGATDLSTSDDHLARFEASGWETGRVDGHDPEAIAAAIAAARETDRPTLIACKTVIGFGAPTKQGTAATHGAPLGDDELTATREALGWTHGPFELPERALAAWRAAGARGADEHAAWRNRLEGADAALRETFLSTLSGDLPEGWDTALKAHIAGLIADAPTLASRVASQKALEALVPANPAMIGGSADLTGSNNTRAGGMTPVKPGDYAGNYIHYGVREHGMGAAMNGLALHGGFIPYGGTFLVFADYCRPAIRLAALMGTRVIHVLTHDSIGLGEDGPTHQPVEHLASLRAMPNVAVFRPADAVETAECWALALQNDTGPSLLALSRQGLPTLRKAATEDMPSARGAYVLAEAEGGDRRVTLMATGSEVMLAMTARDTLQGEGIPTAVVSMPCWELFAKQDETYRESVLGTGTVRVAVEAACGMGWERWIGDNGAFVGMDGFGASAPAPQLYQHFGITAEAMVAAAKARL